MINYIKVHINEFSWFWTTSRNYMKGHNQLWVMLRIPFKFIGYRKAMNNFKPYEYEMKEY